jgi:hypothetical protein
VFIRGGEIGRLSNSYDRITLLRPGGTEADPDASEPLLVDEVLYDDLAPWPQAADGTGASLQRVSGTSYGNLAGSWYAATPTPGRPSFGGPRGDFNDDGLVDEVDINLLFAQIRAAVPDVDFDLTGDAMVNETDRDEMILNVLGTTFGDANLDGIFNSSDLVQVFAVGKYEDNAPLNAGWSDGDWNADGDFGTGDLVLAFQQGGYTAASEPAHALARQHILAATLAWLDPSTASRTADRESLEVKPEHRLLLADRHPRWDANDRAVQSLFDHEPSASETLADGGTLDDDLIELLFDGSGPLAP